MKYHKTVVIHQPDFLPYIGFFHRLLHSDLYVVLDNVQFVRGSNSWHNRDKIKTPQGEKWITVTTQKKHHTALINEMELYEKEKLRERHLNLFRSNYIKANFYKEIFSYIEQLYNYECEKMIDFNMKSILILMQLFDIDIKYIFASDIQAEGKGNGIIVDILKKVNATTYLSGIGAKSYYEPTLYEEAGIKVVFQEFEHPVYPQLFGNFIPYLSSIDLLFNCGIEKSREIIRSI
jgi:hypothetical protein